MSCLFTAKVKPVVATPRRAHSSTACTVARRDDGLLSIKNTTASADSRMPAWPSDQSEPVFTTTRSNERLNAAVSTAAASVTSSDTSILRGAATRNGASPADEAALARRDGLSIASSTLSGFGTPKR